MKKVLLIVFGIMAVTAFGQTGLTIATWNIEHLGSGGRGFPELPTGTLKDRTEDDYKKIAALIRDSLSLEIVCVQEIGSSKKEAGKSYSNELGKITTNLGSNWKYYLANFVDGDHSNNEMQNAFVYDQSKVELIKVFEMSVPDYEIVDDGLFERKPLVGYFMPKGKEDGFVIVNLHLASGKDNYENHLAAMIIVEQNLKKQMEENGMNEKEEDIIILGDFNDNPYEYSDLMYTYMKDKGYSDMVDASFGSTRMDKKLKSIIDHILLSKSAKKHVSQTKASVYKPKNMSEEGLKNWRTVYSDHFPLYIEYK